MLIKKAAYNTTRIAKREDGKSDHVTGHLAVWLDTMLEAEQFPTRVPDLHTPLADMEANALTHGYFGLYAS